MENHQIASNILMIRPANFAYNAETAANNAFQSIDHSLSAEEVQVRAQQEFDEFVQRLREAGMNVHVAEDSPSPVKPDAVFPNNWVTFHEDGRVATYPMNAPTRRHERREGLIESLGRRFSIRERIHFEEAEAEDRFLEGTGSLILDRPNAIAYACLSPRTDEALLKEYGQRMGYETVAFTAADGEGKAIYHTNVMMALGQDFVVICLDTVKDEQERALLLQKFEATGKEVIEIDLSQMMAFAGNMLQVSSEDGQAYLVMSEQAFKSLRPEQVAAIEQRTRILHSPLYTIEQHGGGSARCMMAEIFLKERGD